MKKSLLFAATALMMMSSCVKNEVIEGSSTPQAIGFNTFVGNITKAGEDTSGFDVDDIFTVNAYYTKTTDFASASGGNFAQFMESQTVTKQSDGTWTYSPLKYWPNNTDEKISFFAVTDATSNSYEFDESSTTNDAVSFTVADTSADIMVAAIVNQTKTTDALKFSFKHINSYVEFTAALTAALAEPTKTTIKVTSLTVNYGSATDAGGTYTFLNSATADNPAGQWSAVSGGSAKADTVFDTDGSDGIGTALSDASVTAIGTPLFVMPLDGNSFEVTLVYDVTTTDSTNTANSSTITNTCTFDIAPTAQNTKYTYAMQIAMTGVKVTGTVTEWTTGNVVEEDVVISSSTATI